MLRSLAALTLLLSLTGCDPIIRMYGDWRLNDGYDTEEAHREQIADLVEDYAAQTLRTQAAVSQLALAAEQDGRLAPVAARAVLLAEMQEALLAEHTLEAAELIEDGDYRELNRGYGAMITEHAILNDRFYDLGRSLEAFSDSVDIGQIESIVVRSRYQIIPPEYLRNDYAARQPSLRVPPISGASETIADDAVETRADL
jgi:hypothetical protein